MNDSDAEIVVQSGVSACFTAVSSFPASYDLRNVSGSNYVTSVKSQGSWGTCWAFATYASVESSILVDSGTTTNMSERNAAYMHGFDWDVNVGGNSYISEAYLSRGSGAISEATDPYTDMGTPDTITGPIAYYVTEMLRLDSDSDIKTAIMTYGAVLTSMCWSDSSYRSSDYTYYYSGTASTNHDVAIIGWDDTKVTAGGTGAWLCKNSWGTTWGNSGYFWISYADTKGANTAEAYTGVVSGSTYSDVYYWDEFGNIGSLSTPYAFNAYTAASDCDLLSVGFYTLSDSASYTVTIYDTYSNGTLSSVLGTVSGSETYAGYHTVDLSSAISLASGNDFYVCLHIISSSGFPMAMDYEIDGYTSDCVASSGQSYYSFNGTSWTDLTSHKSTANFCIKAYVLDTSAEPTTVTLVSTSDTGSSSSDLITNRDNSSSSKTLQFLVTGVTAGATVTIYSSGTAIGSTVATGTSATVTTSGTYDLVDGARTITARQTVPGEAESADSAALMIYIDTAAPTATVPDLADADDTGISCTDNLTQGVHPTFNGTASDPTSNSYTSGVWKVVVAADDGRSGTDSASPYYSVTTSTLTEGTRTVSATVYDVAGNSYTTAALTVTVDQMMPTVTINQASTQSDPATSLPIHFLAVFSSKVNNFDDWDLSGVPLGAAATITAIGTAGTDYDIAISGLTEDTTLTITIGSGLVTDDAGNVNSSSTSTDNTVTFDRLEPVATVTLNTSSPQTNDILTATATKTGYYGETVWLTYVWLVNGTVVRTYSSDTALTDTLDLGVSGNGNRGDAITVQVMPCDELEGATVTASATVADTQPVATVSLSQASPLTNSVLVATATKSDVDADTVSLTYVWKVNGVTKRTFTSSTLLTDSFDLSVDGNGNRGDVVTCEVVPTDGTLTGATVSATATVANTAPVAAVGLDTTTPRTDAVLTATATTSDDDSDSVTVTYVWKVNGVAKQTHTLAGGLADTFDLSISGYGDVGDVIIVEVTPSDGTASGTAVTQTATVVSSTRTWVGGGADANWTTAANWADGIAPIAGDSLVFTGTTQTSSVNDFTAGTVFESITFSSGGFALSGNAVTLDADGGTAVDNLAGDNEIDLALTLGSSCAFAIAADTGLSLTASATIATNGYTLTCDGQSSDTTNQWAGEIGGSGGVTKTGSGVLSLSGSNTYTGTTTVIGGTLTLVGAAYANVLNTANAGADIQGGTLIFDYTGLADPVDQIRANLRTTYLATNGAMTSGLLYSSIGGALNYTVGYLDDTEASTVTLKVAQYGDANLDGMVNYSDLNKVLTNYNGAGDWGQGDFDYGGSVDYADLNKVLTNYNASLLLSASSISNDAEAAVDAVFEMLGDSSLV
ncbi:MAG: lectin like domain-containing protein [Thermoguttaceae bacterium]